MIVRDTTDGFRCTNGVSLAHARQRSGDCDRAARLSEGASDDDGDRGHVRLALGAIRAIPLLSNSLELLEQTLPGSLGTDCKSWQLLGRVQLGKPRRR